MIDRATRDETVAAIEAYMNDEITAFAFADTTHRIATGTKDEAVGEAVETLWYFYDDITNHKIVANKEEWNLMQRFILFLQSDAELATKCERQWSVTQIVALCLIAFIVLFAWIFGESWILFITWIGAGALTWEIDRRFRAPLRAGRLIDVITFPFDSSLDIIRAARTVSNFHKRRFPQELAKRRIRNGWLGRLGDAQIHIPRPILLPFAFIGWTIILPCVLFWQLFPLYVHQRAVIIPTVSHRQ